MSESGKLEDCSGPACFYETRANDMQTLSTRAAADFRLCRLGLVAFGVAASTILVASFYFPALPFWTAALPLAGGVFCAGWIPVVRRRSLRLDSLARYYESGLARLAREWDSLDEGAEFADREHEYANDLGLFGRGSLFQLLCSARTQGGRETLAQWMKTPARAAEILRRQEAVAELRGRRDLRERMASAAPARISDYHPEVFRNWFSEPRIFRSWQGVPAFIFPLALPVIFVMLWTGLLERDHLRGALLAWATVQGLVYSTLHRRVRYVVGSMGLPSTELPLIFEVLSVIDESHFSSPKLVEIAARLRLAAVSLRRLRLFVGLLEQRRRQGFLPISYCLLWSTQFAMAIEHWRWREGTQMLRWLETLGEFEALICLSTYSFEHPADTFPEILTGSPGFYAQGLGHPLLDEETAVRNDMALGEGAGFLVVSGSNMSGKSTFLRAVGLNAVLTYMGATVRCTRLRLSVMAIASAIRVEDNLAEGKSRFYAEMLRLKEMIERSALEPLIFLIDEIMSGTNSQDRRIAGEWVVQALTSNRAVGLISTHDLKLTEIALRERGGRNVHFRDCGENGELRFDYRLRTGVLTQSNALNIAQLLGIGPAVAARRRQNPASDCAWHAPVRTAQWPTRNPSAPARSGRRGSMATGSTRHRRCRCNGRKCRGGAGRRQSGP